MQKKFIPLLLLIFASRHILINSGITIWDTFYMIHSIRNFVTRNVTKIYHGHSNIILDLSGFKFRIYWAGSDRTEFAVEFLILRYVASLKAGQSALYTTHVMASEIQNGLAEKRTRMDADGCTEYRNLLCDKICRPTPRLFQRTPRRTARRNICIYTKLMYMPWVSWYTGFVFDWSRLLLSTHDWHCW